LGLLSLAAQAAAPPPADAERGAVIYERCIACHSLARNRTGPRHCRLIGRAAGTQEGYRYSKALRAWGKVWSAETLDVFLENPRRTVPGTKMTYAGVKDASERADLIAYLIRETGPNGACP
jgi:cytochrome c